MLIQNDEDEAPEGVVGKPLKRGRKLRERLASAPSDKRDQRMQFAVKVRGVLVKTPADARGMVEGTPFTQAGVARLMALLDQRAGAGSAGAEGKQSKIAARMLKFLAPDTVEEPAVLGVSVEKLRKLATRTEKLKERGGLKRFKE